MKLKLKGQLCFGGFAGVAILAAVCSNLNAATSDWPEYLGGPGRNHYSNLDQINRRNVHLLKLAWTHHTGDGRADNGSQIQCNPIVVGSVLYGTSAQGKAIALNAFTGERIWTFDPFADSRSGNPVGVNRGVVFWRGGRQKRIFFTAAQSLYALDADTGKPAPEFGESGMVDLREGLDRDAEGLYVQSSTPGALIGDLLILGTRVSEGPGPSAPGHIRAYDVRTGKRVWIFHTIPHPGEFGYETWPEDAWTRAGGANSWSGMSVDRDRGIVFVPTGSPAFDFWGGNRVGDNLFGNCLLALDARTGKRLWHFQVVRHDLWDRDLPAPPNLVSVRRDGRRVDAVAQITKSGHIFLLDRETGAPLFPVEEQEVPLSDLKGEITSTNQPVPLKPAAFARQAFTEADVTDISPEAHADALERLRKSRTGRQFIPPSTAGTVIFPGFDGGGEWGGAGFDPSTGILYVNGNEMPWILTMVNVSANRGGTPATLGEQIYNLNCVACHGFDRLGDPLRTVPSIVDVKERLKKTEVLQNIESGKGNMPSFGFLSSPEKQAVTAFLFGETSEQISDRIERRRRPESAQDVPYTHTGYNRFLDQDGYPAVKPPWGTLNAINLNTGEYEWKIPLGEFSELTRRGIAPTGTENYGGPVVTSGGLVFIGASKDEKFRAFDKSTGKLLWETGLPAGGYATPCTYSVNGRQFVVIAAGGGKMGTKSGDAYVAYALPE